MPFVKGKSGNQSGKPKGLLSKKTIQWEAFSEYCLTGGLEKYQRELNSLSGEKFVNAFHNLLEFHKPKLARTELTGMDGKDLMPTPTINIKPVGK